MYGRVQHSRKYRAVYGHDPRPDRANPTVASRIENAADAALISAAPDLLEAAKAVLAHPLADSAQGTLGKALSALRAAIAKAEGRASC